MISQKEKIQRRHKEKNPCVASKVLTKSIFFAGINLSKFDQKRSNSQFLTTKVSSFKVLKTQKGPLLSFKKEHLTFPLEVQQPVLEE